LPLLPVHSVNVCGKFQFWQNMGMFAAVSNDTQHALAVMLEDEKFIDSYVSENKR
jgi:1-aminocyclopropane-1-carboxylate synthase